MKGFLMIVLTFLDDGSLSAAFVNTPTLEECKARAEIVRTILEDQKLAIEALACRPSDLTFEPFQHGPSGGTRHRYAIALGDDAAEVAPLAEDQACAPSAAGEAGIARFCVTSAQKLLPGS